MKSSIKKFMLSAGILSCAFGASAQMTYSGYFLDNYAYRYQMNPAFGNERGFVSMPALGDLNIGMHGTLNISDVVYPLNGKTVLFTNPGLSEKEVMSKFKDRNRLGSNVKLDILSVGFKAFGGYNAVSLSAVANLETSVPKSFFKLAKEGVTNDTYDISDMFGYADAYAQIALNHSRDIKQVPGLRVGASLKVLVGFGNVDFKFNDAYLQLGENEWIAKTNADIYASVTGLEFDHDINDKTGNRYVSGANVDDGYGTNGFGMALDLGAEYKWNDFRFSAAVLDLGFINWGKTKWASTNGDKTVITNAYTFNANDDASNSFSKEWDRFTGDLAQLYELEDMGELKSRSKMLGATLNFGVDYEFPLYRRLNFGLLNSTRVNGCYSWTQFRLSADVNPIDFLSLGVNGVVGTYGAGFGWMLNIHTTGFNLFAGMDHTVGKLSKQFIPLHSNNSFNFGINFPF